MLVSILVSIALNAIAYLLTPKPEAPKVQPSTLDVPEPKDGQPIPVVFGDVWIDSPGVVYYGNERTYPIRSKGSKK